PAVDVVGDGPVVDGHDEVVPPGEAPPALAVLVDGLPGVGVVGLPRGGVQDVGRLAPAAVGQVLEVVLRVVVGHRGRQVVDGEEGLHDPVSVGSVHGRVGEADPGRVGAVLELHVPGEDFGVDGGGGGARAGGPQVHHGLSARGGEGDPGRVPGRARYARAVGAGPHAPAVGLQVRVGVRGVVEVVEQDPAAARVGRIGRVVAARRRAPHGLPAEVGGDPVPV